MPGKEELFIPSEPKRLLRHGEIPVEQSLTDSYSIIIVQMHDRQLRSFPVYLVQYAQL